MRMDCEGPFISTVLLPCSPLTSKKTEWLIREVNWIEAHTGEEVCQNTYFWGVCTGVKPDAIMYLLHVAHSHLERDGENRVFLFIQLPSIYHLVWSFTHLTSSITLCSATCRNTWMILVELAVSRVMPCRVEVKSELVSLESFVEDDEWLCCPDIGREFVPPLRCQRVMT